MTFEERAQDDPRYRGKLPEAPKLRLCSCGKTVHVDSFGTDLRQTCPQCETNSHEGTPHERS